MVLLLAMLVIRFDSESLLRSKVTELASGAGVDMAIGEIGWVPGGIRLNQLSIMAAGLPEPLLVEQVVASPSLTQLLQGSLAAGIELLWQGITLSADISQSGNRLLVSDIDISGEMGKFLTAVNPMLQLSVPVSASGAIGVSGNVELDSATGAPQAGTLTATWSQANIEAMGASLDLGSIVLNLDEEQQGWKWTLRNDGTGLVQGTGRLHKGAMAIAAWPITGDIEINTAAVNDPALMTLLAGQSGGRTIKITIAGTLQNPRYTIGR